MRPRLDTRIDKIISVGLGLHHAFIPLCDSVCIALITGVRDGFGFTVEAKFDLSSGIWRRRPPHQRIWFGAGIRLKFNDPMLYVAAPGLHRVLGRSVNSHMHGITLVFQTAVDLDVPLNGRES